MLAAFVVAPSCPARNERLLLLSSHESVPFTITLNSSTALVTASSVSGESSATVLPSSITSLPPYDHSHGYQNTRGSVNEWPSAWPNGCPALFNAFAISIRSSIVLGTAMLFSLNQS